MNGRRLIWILAGLFVLWWIITEPHAAATFVQGIIGWFRHAGSSIATFLSSV